MSAALLDFAQLVAEDTRNPWLPAQPELRSVVLAYVLLARAHPVKLLRAMIRMEGKDLPRAGAVSVVHGLDFGSGVFRGPYGETTPAATCQRLVQHTPGALSYEAVLPWAATPLVPWEQHPSRDESFGQVINYGGAVLRATQIAAQAPHAARHRVLPRL